MSESALSASVGSVESLRLFKAALVKFAEAANVALGDAESDLTRTQTWLEGEQLTHWVTQVRKRTEAVVKAKEAVRYKKLFKNAVGGKDSVVDEEKALAKAMRALQEAEQKLAATKQWGRRVQKEVQNYKGATQRLATTVQGGIPVAIAKLERMASILDAYASAGTGGLDLPQALPPVGGASTVVAAPAAEGTTPPAAPAAADAADAGPDRPQPPSAH